MKDDASRDGAGGQAGMAWARSHIDLEGWVVAVAALLVGFLLGLLWSPLFAIGAGAAILALLASRHADRVPPDLPGGVIAPVDGVVESVFHGDPDADFGLSGEGLCIRIASSPASSNLLYAPLTGSVARLTHEAGDQSVILASRPYTRGLETLHIAIDSEGTRIGVRVATGALGPRLEALVDEGDSVRAGRRFGKRRLGGWCEVWLPAGLPALVRPGQTLVGGETVLAHLAGAVAAGPEGPGMTPGTMARGTEPQALEDTAAAMFARLRREVAARKDDEDDAPQS